MKLKSYIIIAFLSFFIVGCGTKKNVVRSKKNIPKETTSIKKMPSVKQNAHVKKLLKEHKNLNKYTLTYIKKYAPLAVIKMHEFKIPASITLAQGILESGNGRSTLASKSNNHFGIKCHKGWEGKKVYHDDDKKDDCFRKYKYVENSYNDHSKFLTGRKRYAFLFKYRTSDYKKWARGLKKAGYATDRKYPSKLIRIIETYELYEFDKIKKSDLKKYKKEVKKRKPKSVSVKRTTKTVKIASGITHTVQKGETLYSISRRYNISVQQLKKNNNLSGNTISVGQKLRIN
ncbi:Autolysin [Polaribacter huanghezhanensis]|uniref:glucosaminidase domain-containing protein n=1 Tax=Polaribacter huanghezhanensis TaxID=1354726 RepID=UPI002647E4ED|nr:glucosaminidase domain-containing protein [Polaribacter huanghezhanensis]WKD84976.1 Autolysin [Polaribacter huanghezhanensis]